MNIIKKYIKKILLKEKADSETYIKWMRKKGVRIGERVTIFSPRKTLIDLTRPWLIEIGNDVQITEDVIILTHGYDWSVLKGIYGEVLGSSGKVKIGNNVFIGMRTTILKGTTIGDNVIIGANSLINKNIPDNCVVAGNPAKVIMTTEEYYIKRKEKQIKEVTELIKEYRKVYNKEPSEKELSEFFYLYINSEKELCNYYKEKLELVGNFNFSIERLKENNKKFLNLEELLFKIK